VSDIRCPYCDAKASVNYDDGHGCEEDKLHEMTCPSCDKSFVFTTYISFSHTAYRADCLNGSPHEMAMTLTYPRRYARMACANCDHEEALPPEMLASIIANEQQESRHAE